MPTTSRPAPIANPLVVCLDALSLFETFVVPMKSVASAKAGREVAARTRQSSGRRHRSRMNFDFTADQELLRRSVRQFAETELGPHTREWDEAQQFPRELLSKLAAL